MVDVFIKASGALYCIVEYENRQYTIQIEWLHNIQNNVAQLDRKYLCNRFEVKA